MLNKARIFFENWWEDIVKGITGGSLASYIFNHLSDLFWTGLATVVVTILAHFTKKKIVPWLERIGIM